MAGIFTGIFLYKTVKYTVSDIKTIAILYRLIQLSICAYTIGWVFVINKGYQEKDEQILSSVVAKLKGVSVTNTTSGRMVWGPEDYAVSPKGEASPFIVTNFIETPNQKLGLCPEVGIVVGECRVATYLGFVGVLMSPEVFASHCTTDENCKEGRIVLYGNGVMSGKCRKDENSKGTCEIYGWCPMHNHSDPQKHLLSNAENLTIYIKNFIQFTHLDFAKSNVLEATDNSYLRKCQFSVKHNLYCPIFRLGDITKMAGHNFQDMAFKGGIIGITIEWNCDLDKRNCNPEYRFARLDRSSLNKSVTAGVNFRHTQYFQNEAGERSRVLYKVYGIRLNIMVHGKAVKFSIIPTMINIASAMGMMGFAAFFCDILLDLMKRSLANRERKLEGTGSDIEISDSAHDERKGLSGLKLLNHCFHCGVHTGPSTGTPTGPPTAPTGAAAPLPMPPLA